MSELYNTPYFNRARKHLIHRLFIHFVHRKEPVLRLLRKKMPATAKLLDVGCGDGSFLSHAQKYFKCTGFDISRSGIKDARRKAPQAKIFVQSVYAMKAQKKESYDIITAFGVLEHLLNPVQVLKAIQRILKPNGIFVFSLPNYDCISRSLKWRQWFGFSDPTHLSFYSVAEWSYILKQEGFVPMKTYYNGLMDPPYTDWLPQFLQVLLIKYPMQGLSFFGFPWPKALGEDAYTICLKNPGLESPNYRLQLQMLKKKGIAPATSPS